MIKRKKETEWRTEREEESKVDSLRSIKKGLVEGRDGSTFPKCRLFLKMQLSEVSGADYPAMNLQ